MIGWLRDLPGATIVHHEGWPQPAPRGEHGLAEMPERLYDQVDEYARSTPTAASAGRIYRRLHRMDGVNDQPCLFIVEDDPVDPSGQYHHPHLVLFAGGPS